MSLPNDSRIVVLFHAAMRLGAVWVGVNRALAAPEQETILQHSGARLAVGCPSRDGSTPQTVLLSEQAWEQALESARPVRELKEVDPYAAAAIAYTSGTTGQPKGVVHSQHNLLVPGAVLCATRGYDRTLRKADSLPMTILNMLVLSTLLTSQAGGTAVISDIRDARRIVGWLNDTQATVWNGVPTMLYDLASGNAIGDDALDGLVEVWSGGDNLSEDIRAAVARKFGRRIIGTYGLTEAPTVVAIEEPDREHVPGGSGTVLPHLRAFTHPAGDGSASADSSEVCVTAAGTGDYAGLYTPMLGYWADPPATAAALRDGVLRTGDLGRVDETGQVFITDRRKLVIVRGGANVYPAEVERIIQSCAGVVAAVVLAIPDDRLGSRVAAVVQASPESPVELIGLQEHCRGLLARYKVPERWRVTTEELPRNAMGKIDRQQLAATFGPERLVPRRPVVQDLCHLVPSVVDVQQDRLRAREPRSRGGLRNAAIVNDRPTRGDVRMAEHLIEREHWRHARVKAGENLHPLVPRPPGEDLGERRLQFGPATAIHLPREIGAVQIEALQQGGVELRLDRAHRDKASVGALVGVIEGGGTVEKVLFALVDPLAGVEQCPHHLQQQGPTVDHRRIDDLAGARARGFPDRGQDADDEQHRTSAIVTNQVQRRKGPLASPADRVQRTG